MLIKSKQPGRNPSREEIHEKTNVGFEPAYQTRLTKSVSFSHISQQVWDGIFGKKDNQ